MSYSRRQGYLDNFVQFNVLNYQTLFKNDQDSLKQKYFYLKKICNLHLISIILHLDANQISKFIYEFLLSVAFKELFLCEVNKEIFPCPKMFEENEKYGQIACQVHLALRKISIWSFLHIANGKWQMSKKLMYRTRAFPHFLLLLGCNSDFFFRENDQALPRGHFDRRPIFHSYIRKYEVQIWCSRNCTFQYIFTPMNGTLGK